MKQTSSNSSSKKIQRSKRKILSISRNAINQRILLRRKVAKINTIHKQLLKLEDNKNILKNIISDLRNHEQELLQKINILEDDKKLLKIQVMELETNGSFIKNEINVLENSLQFYTKEISHYKELLNSQPFVIQLLNIIKKHIIKLYTKKIEVEEEDTATAGSQRRICDRMLNAGSSTDMSPCSSNQVEIDHHILYNIFPEFPSIHNELEGILDQRPFEETDENQKKEVNAIPICVHINREGMCVLICQRCTENAIKSIWVDTTS